MLPHDARSGATPRRHRNVEGDGDRRREEGERPRAGDRGPQAHHRQAPAQHVRRLVREWQEAARSARTAARRARGGHGRGQSGRSDCGTARLGHGGQRRRRATPKARSPAAPQPSAARARRACGTVRMSRLRRQLEEARRGRHRDAGARAGAVEGDPARAREVCLPQVSRPSRSRRRHRIRSHAAAPGRKLLAAGPVRQVPGASAAQPAERHLCQRRHRSRRVDVGRLGRRVRSDADAAGRRDPQARLCS